MAAGTTPKSRRQNTQEDEKSQPLPMYIDAHSSRRVQLTGILANVILHGSAPH
jgi:hypothetical protein